MKILAIYLWLGSELFHAAVSVELNEAGRITSYDVIVLEDLDLKPVDLRRVEGAYYAVEMSLKGAGHHLA